jgi:Tol biopolymer transport system component
MFLLSLFPCGAQSFNGPLGQFTGEQDIGTVLHAGSGQYDGAAQTYTLSGSGDNTWFTSDDLHYMWAQVDGDITLSAQIDFANSGGNPHKKAMLMIRQSLAADSPYVDVARHGNGLTSLQYRNAAADVTREIELNVSGPPKVRIAKRGDFFYVWYAGADGKWQYSGASMELPMQGPFYVGLGVCSHDKDVVETAKFSDVHFAVRPHSTGGMGAENAGKPYSTLEVVPIASTDRRVVYVAAAHFEAPNWLPDNSGFLVNEEGHIERIGAKGEAPVTVDTGSLDRINNDHVLSPDGKRVAISDNTEPGGSRIYTFPLAGGQPQKITENAPSYAHGWSPDGKTIAFCGERNGEFDVYIVPAAGGPTADKEKRLTTAKGLDDGPNYSPDGKYIYFNSERTGHMQIWRMLADGSQQEQVTHEATNDWFAHISPDGKWMVYLAYGPEVTGHPPGKDVTLQVMSLADGKTSTLAKLFGGQGTINVPSWSPDSADLAFVSYAFVPDVGWR